MVAAVAGLKFDPVEPPVAAAPGEDVALDINGRAVRVAAEAGATLLEVLRNHLGLTGSRFGCGLEQCGACMVLVDGRPRHACQLSAADMAGRSIVTIEGVCEDAAGHALVAALIGHQAGQCGYCLSGIAITAHAWLHSLTVRPERAEIAAALDGHLCRCGAHPRILTAIERAAQARFPAGA